MQYFKLHDFEAHIDSPNYTKELIFNEIKIKFWFKLATNYYNNE